MDVDFRAEIRADRRAYSLGQTTLQGCLHAALAMDLEVQAFRLE